MSNRINTSEIMEGTLDLMLRKRAVIGCFVIADIALTFGAALAEMWLGLGVLIVVGFVFTVSMLFHGILVLALGEQLTRLMSDPVELFTRLVFVLAIVFIQGVVGGMAMLFLIVPGLYLIARWIAAIPLIMLEGSEIFDALGRSWRLTESSAWSLTVAIAIVSGIQLAIPVAEYALPESGSHTSIIAAVVFGVIGSVFAAFSIALEVFVYRKLSA